MHLRLRGAVVVDGVAGACFAAAIGGFAAAGVAATALGAAGFAVLVAIGFAAGFVGAAVGLVAVGCAVGCLIAAAGLAAVFGAVGFAVATCFFIGTVFAGAASSISAAASAGSSGDAVHCVVFIAIGTIAGVERGGGVSERKSELVMSPTKMPAAKIAAMRALRQRGCARRSRAGAVHAEKRLAAGAIDRATRLASAAMREPAARSAASTFVAVGLMPSRSVMRRGFAALAIRDVNGFARCASCTIHRPAA